MAVITDNLIMIQFDDSFSEPKEILYTIDLFTGEVKSTYDCKKTIYSLQAIPSINSKLDQKIKHTLGLTR